MKTSVFVLKNLVEYLKNYEKKISRRSSNSAAKD